jgi:transcriptional regulator with XRE-family HTH domain
MNSLRTDPIDLLKSDALPKVLATLTPRQEKIFRMRYGWGEIKKHSRKEVAEQINVSASTVRKWELAALEVIKHPSRQRILNEFKAIESNLMEIGLDAIFEPEGQTIELVDVVSSVRHLSTHLIHHLKMNIADIQKLRWDVFEHLIAEFFASWGFPDVRLVGRDPLTSADIFAVGRPDPTGVSFRYFVEVRRRERRIDVNVIDRVYGALVQERPRYGWHVAMIVSSVNFTAFRKKGYSREELALKGVELRNQEAVKVWLEEYEPNANGLWLPRPLRHLKDLQH